MIIIKLVLKKQPVRFWTRFMRFIYRMMACLPTVNNVSVPAKGGKIVDQMCNISSNVEFDPLKVLSPILQHTNFNFFTVKVTKINNFPEHPHLNHSISFNDAARLMLSKFHLLLDIQVFKRWAS